MFSNTTASDRVAASNASYEILLAAETARRMILRIYERWFPRMWTGEWQELDTCDMDEISDQLEVIADLLFNAITETYLENGEADLHPGAKRRLEIAESYRTYNEVSGLIGRVDKLHRRLEGKASEEVEARRIEAMKLPDNEAIAALTALLKEAEGKPPKGETA